MAIIWQTTVSVVHSSVFFVLLNAGPQHWTSCDSICHTIYTVFNYIHTLYSFTLHSTALYYTLVRYIACTLPHFITLCAFHCVILHFTPLYTLFYTISPYITFKCTNYCSTTQSTLSFSIEPQILDYQTQQMKLFPAISTAYAMMFAGAALRKIYYDILAAVERGDTSRLAEVCRSKTE